MTKGWSDGAIAAAGCGVGVLGAAAVFALRRPDESRELSLPTPIRHWSTRAGESCEGHASMKGASPHNLRLLDDPLDLGQYALVHVDCVHAAPNARISQAPAGRRNGARTHPPSG